MCLCRQSDHCECRCLPSESRKGPWRPWNWGYRWYEPPGMVAENSSGLLQEQFMLSPAEPSLQPWVVHLQPAPPSMSSLCSKWRSLPLVSQFLMLKNYILLRTVSPPPRFPFPLVYLCELFSSVVTFLKAARLPGHQHFSGLISCSFAAFILGWHGILLLKPMTLALASELGKGTGEFISLGLQSQSSALHWGPCSSLLSRSIAKTIAEFLSLSKDLEARITFNHIYSFEKVSECAVVCMWKVSTQLAGLGLLFLLCGSWGSNSCHQVFASWALTPMALHALMRKLKFLTLGWFE